jgi:anthraniloyl-CoA monooxygenase
MKIACVGGGPSGLYVATLAKLRNPDHRVTVIERNPAGVTHGWGVVFGEDFLDQLYRNDPVSAREIRAITSLWDDQHVHIGGRTTAHLGGYGFSVGRKRLLDILAARALSLGVDVRFEHEVEDFAEVADADLVVAGDGVNSRVRQVYAEHFQPSLEPGRNKYIWLGTHKVFNAFTFAFEQTSAGWIWFHAYRFSPDTSTCIVECSPETWTGLGFDELAPDESTRLMEDIFKRYLDGHGLINQMAGLGKTPWLNFTRVANTSWYHQNVVLVGDAAHTTHFSIGSGTRLALDDAVVLADRLHEHSDLSTALQAYQEERQAAVRVRQSEADNSARWFEEVHRYVESDPVRFTYSMWERRLGPARGQAAVRSPRWRYQVHRATQYAPLRGARQGMGSVRRRLRDRRRG